MFVYNVLFILSVWLMGHIWHMCVNKNATTMNVHAFEANYMYSRSSSDYTQT